MSATRTLAAVALAATTVAATAADAQAKVSCRGIHPAADIRMKGLPPEPVADVRYRVRLEVPRAPHANPRPGAMFVRCGGARYAGFAVDVPVGRRVAFPLRFSKPGRWRAVLMDRGGTFHSLGTLNVGTGLGGPAAALFARIVRGLW